MASFDSGVETGNESNDGPLDSKSDAPSPDEPELTLCVPQICPPMQHENFKVGCLPGSGIPQFKLPLRSILPPGFGENFEMPLMMSEPKRSIRWSQNEPIFNGAGKCSGVGGRRLRIAVSTNNVELVQHCLRSGVDPNSADMMGRSPLHLACCRGYSEIVRLLLENGADPNVRDRLGNTPLHLAACTNNIGVVTLLLKAGTDVTSSDSYGRSPLQLAQSKLGILRRYSLSKHDVRSQDFQAGLSCSQDLNTIRGHEIPVYDNTYVANQALQIVEMMKLFLKKRGQDAEAELLNAFSTRLTFTESHEEVETHVKDLLDSLSSLSLHSVTENDSPCKNMFYNVSTSPPYLKALPAPPCSSASLSSSSTAPPSRGSRIYQGQLVKASLKEEFAVQESQQMRSDVRDDRESIFSHYQCRFFNE